MERDMEKLHERIRELKTKRNAVIMAHNYQLGEVQDVADYVGDSLELAKIARQGHEEVIVFCGVHFMAETAHILAPQKIVLLPEEAAGCALADKGDPEDLRRLKRENPDMAVVCYVNSSAEVKALSDICCTSANAEKIVGSIQKGREVYFVPDQYLGGYVSQRLDRPIRLPSGYCPTHARMTLEEVKRKRREYPKAELMVHPESRREVVAEADVVTGTGGMLRYVKSSSADTFLVGTEVGLIHRLQKENPDKRFVAVSQDAICPDMKLISLESIVRALEEDHLKITLPEKLRNEAHEAVRRMVEGGH